MYSTSLVKPLTANSILSMISEYDIFSYYLGNNLQVNLTIHSPLRKDERPSFVIYKASYGFYKLRFMDHCTGEGGTCFDLIMKMFHCTFVEALMIIDRDFRLGIVAGKVNFTPVRYYRSEADMELVRDKCLIEVGIRNWDSVRDKGYWGSFGITGKTLVRYNVYPLSHFRLNGYEYAARGLTYGYYFGEQLWKVYSPDPVSNRKWLSNTNSSIIQGYQQLQANGDYLVITKSLKDVMVLSEHGIPAIAPQSENVLIKGARIEELKQRFRTIYVNFDFDYAGVRGGNKYRKAYGLTCKYFTNGKLGSYDYEVKDCAEFVKKYGAREFSLLMSTIREHEEF